IVFVPLFLIGAVAFASGTAAFLPFVILGVVILLPVALVVQGFVAAQSSTYWTLAFRRLDLELAPAYSYPYQPIPQPPQITSSVKSWLAFRRATTPTQRPATRRGADRRSSRS